MNPDPKPPTFWKWFFIGYLSGRAGWKKLFLGWWMLLHMLVGIIAALFLWNISIKQISGDVAIPVSAILIGLCLAGSSNAYALLRDGQLRTVLFDKHPDGVSNYIYTYQMGILLFITTIVYWVVIKLAFGNLSCIPGAILKFFGFTLLSMAVRECWSLTLGLSHMLGIKHKYSSKDEE